ncbi:MAG: FliA/WhiG family RNA polymerase sigma factor [Nocardioides sp.]|nr:FliA/WhiG family RNA polymerase sigma factor [Nocardioides sp.]
MDTKSTPHETAGTLTDGEREQLVLDHMRLVGYIVRETMARVPEHVSADDLQSAGLTALVKASRSFDPERGVPFPRYAASRVRGAVVDELRQIDWASRSVRRRSRDLEAARTQLANALGRPPENHEVAAALGWSTADVDASDSDVARANLVALNASPDGETTLADVLVSSAPLPSDVVEHRERLQYLVAAIAELPERQRVVVEEYFLAERPMAEIAERLGVTESRVSQIRAEALVLLRDAMNFSLDPHLVAEHPRPQGCAAQRRAAYFQAVASRHAAAAGTGRVAAAAVHATSA